MEKQYFGTDGIRGKVGQAPISPDFMLKLGWAAGKVLGKAKNNRVVIGKDTRISGYMFESALEAGFAAAGVNVLLLGPMPTPAIAYLTQSLQAQLGVVISASHNPFADNGIKFFCPDGKKLSDEMELEIEKFLQQELITVESAEIGKAKRIDDAGARYIEFCKSSLEKSLDLSRKKIVLDCANGATYHIAPELFQELKADLTTIGDQPNGLNINLFCGSTDVVALQKKVLETQADIGIAFDGDGDRVIMVDEKGEIVDGDEIVFILAAHWRPKGVVGTVMSNYGMEQALVAMGIEFIRTPVGDRYIIEELAKRQWPLGGESSGHIICRDILATGDGIIAALQVLAVMQATGKTLHELKSGMQKYPQMMINVAGKNKALITHPTIQAAVQAAEQQMQGKGRVLLRPSGTEPVIRVMVEGRDIKKIQQVATELAAQIKAFC